MKRSTGSLFAGLVLFCFALSAFATQYIGAGTWKSTDGTSGDYSVGANIQIIDDNNLNIEQTLDFGNKTLNINISISKIDETFYDIIDADSRETIGFGYCWPLDIPETKLCHSDSYKDGYLEESTIKLTPSSIYRVGSKTKVEDGSRLIWKDELKPNQN